MSLRALDPEQRELRELRSNGFELKIDDPVELRDAVNTLESGRLIELIDAVAALDEEMDAREGRNWKVRRQAFT